MYYFVITAIEMLKFYLIFRYGFEIKERKIYLVTKSLDIRIVSVIILWISTATIMFFNPDIENYFLFYISWVLIEVFLLCQYPFTKLIFITLCSIFWFESMDNIFFTGLQIIMKRAEFEKDKSSIVLASLFTCIFLSWIISIVSRKHKGRLRGIGIGYFLFVLAVTFANSLIVTLLWRFIFTKEFDYDSITLIGVYITILCSTLVQIVLILRLAVANDVYKERDSLNQNYLKLQEEHYIYLEEKERETKKFRHDVKHHIYMVESLCKERKLEELENYIGAMHEKVDELSNGIYVNNGVIEAILNRIGMLCEKDKINLSVKGQMPTKCYIELFDLCTIFSNVMQNAYEAALGCQNASVKLTIRYEENAIMIKGENTFQEEKMKQVVALCTNKKNRDKHGFGIINIKECIKKYGGTFNYEIIEDESKQMWFVVQIMVFNLDRSKGEEAKRERVSVHG